MHVDAQAALGRDVAQHLDRARAVFHRALEMRNAADHVDALVERAVEILCGRLRAEIAVLRKRDELQVDIGRDLLLHVEQRIDRGQAIVADIDMAADREQALGDREIAIAQRALGDGLGRQQRLQFAPQRDAFEQGAGLVQPRQSQRQRRVHVEMNVDEGRRDQQALRVDGAAGFAGEAAFERRDLAVADADVELAPIGQGGVADDQVEHALIPRSRGPRWARAYCRSRRSRIQFQTPRRAVPPTSRRPARFRDDRAAIHHGHAIGEARRKRQIMHDGEHRAAGARGLAQQLHHGELMARIERGGRLVGEQHAAPASPARGRARRARVRRRTVS